VQTYVGNRVKRTRTFVHPPSPKIRVHTFLAAKRLHSACIAEDVARFRGTW